MCRGLDVSASSCFAKRSFGFRPSRLRMSEFRAFDPSLFPRSGVDQVASRRSHEPEAVKEGQTSEGAVHPVLWGGATKNPAPGRHGTGDAMRYSLESVRGGGELRCDKAGSRFAGERRDAVQMNAAFSSRWTAKVKVA
jgi:hypothetical protein